MKRKNLIAFRESLGLTLEQAAKKIGYSRIYLNNIELGKNAGTIEFWDNFQEVFGIEDYDFWTLIKREKE